MLRLGKGDGRTQMTVDEPGLSVSTDWPTGDGRRQQTGGCQQGDGHPLDPQPDGPCLRRAKGEVPRLTGQRGHGVGEAVSGTVGKRKRATIPGRGWRVQPKEVTIPANQRATRSPSEQGAETWVAGRPKGEDLEIVDAQIHIWRTGLPSNAAHWQITSFTAAEAIALMDAAGVDAAVIHPPSWDPGAVELAFDAVATYPGRFAIIGTLDLGQPEESAAAMEHWRDKPGMLGLRCMFLEGEDRRRLHAGELEWFWTAAERFGIPITTLATGSFGVLGEVARRYPGLRLTIDHLGGMGGNTTLKDDAAMTHMPDLLELARLDNVGVKVTGAPGYCSGEYPFVSMHPYLRRIFDAFGPDRTFWGTDISKMPCSWRQCVTMFTEELPWLAGDDQARVMGGAIRDWWGWPAA